MQRPPSRWAAIATISFCSCVVSTHATQEYWDKYSNVAVPIAKEDMQLTNFRAFVDYDDKMLVLQMSDGLGEISVPVTDNIVGNLRLELEVMPEVYDLLNRGMFEEALEKMRPAVYPLIKFYEVPEQFYDLHGPLQRMLSTLIRLKKYDELEFILSKMDLSRCLIEYSQIAVQLMQTYREDERYEDASRIALSLPVEGRFNANMPAIKEFGDYLRAQEEYALVIPIYKRILELLPADEEGDMPIWLAYCLILNDDLDEAEPLITEISQPASHLPSFSLYQLLTGSLEYRRQQYAVALDILTKGFVRSEPSFSWMPEMLFMIGDCYRQAEQFTAARNVWNEIIILYPNSPWANRAEASMTELPAPKPIPEEDTTEELNTEN